MRGLSLWLVGCAGIPVHPDSGDRPPDGAASKSAVYVASRTVALTTAGRSDQDVSCDQVGDVLLSGSCNGLGDVTVFEAYGTGLDDPDVLATWHCGVETAAASSITVSALCAPG